MLSHRAIIQKAKNEGWKNVLVFEDDIELQVTPSNFLKSQIPNFDILYLSGTFS
jgi:GR25 family glycosyltransferase involved in LPS biosynthesis